MHCPMSGEQRSSVYYNIAHLILHCPMSGEQRRSVYYNIAHLIHALSYVWWTA